MNIGSTARSGSKLGEIINIEDMEVEVPIIDSDVKWINLKHPVRFTSSEIEGEWKGQIRRIGKTIEERTQTIPVYISIIQNGTDKLFDGIFLTAHIPGKRIDDAFIIPRKSIYNDKYVYLIKNGKIEYHEIQIAREETDRIIVKGGIAHGDTLVTELLQGVAPGMPAKSRKMLDSGGQN